MGFLDGIRDALGGFNALKQINSDGFDWREKRAAEQAARDQLAQKYQQENQDYLTKAGSEAAVGGMPEGELGGLLPADLDQAQRRAAIARMVGGAAQAKSSLASQKAQTDALLRMLTNQGQVQVAGVRTKGREDLQNDQQTWQDTRGASPRDEALIRDRGAVQTSLFDRAEAGRNRRAAAAHQGGQGKPQRVVDQNGDYVWLYPPAPGGAPSGGGGVVPSGVHGPSTTVERTRRDQASHVIEQGSALLNELKGPVAGQIGPGGGWVSKGLDVMGMTPSSVSHLNSSLASMSAFLPILHGMRGGENMVQHFQNILGNPYKYGPEQISAATTALMEAAQRIRSQGDQADLTDLSDSLGGQGGGGGAKQHGPAVKKRTSPSGRTQYRDAQGNTWEE